MRPIRSMLRERILNDCPWGLLFCLLCGFFFPLSLSEGVLTLDKGAIRYDGSIVRGKMNGQGTVTFENGDTYKGNFVNGPLVVMAPYSQGWLEI